MDVGEIVEIEEPVTTELPIVDVRKTTVVEGD